MRRLLLLCIPLFILGQSRAEDWPQFLGPRRDGTSTEIIKPWTGELKALWRIPVGEGHSSPVVANGLVFLLDKVGGKNRERLTVFNAENGQKMAETDYERGPFASIFGVGPSATPVVAGDRVYTFGITGHLAATEFKRNGDMVELRPIFATDPLTDFKAPKLRFGVSSTPIVEGDLLIVPVGANGASVVAYDRNDGKVVWKSLDDGASYASPIAVGEGVRRQIIVLTDSQLVSLAPKDGTIVWKFPFRDPYNESSTTPVKDGHLLIISSVKRGTVALKLMEIDGKPTIAKAWDESGLTCYFSTPVPVGKSMLFMLTGVATLVNPSVTLRCIDPATGKVLWSKEKIGRYHAALVRTGDDKLLMLDDNGRLSLVDPNDKEFKLLAESKVCGQTWAHPAVANGRVYLRDARELICLEMPK